MPDNPYVVQLLRFFAQEASIKRPEVATLLGKTVGYVAGIHNRNQKKIGSWPKSITPQRLQNRGCQFPVGTPGDEEFDVCGKSREGGDDLRYKEHKGKIWEPPAEQ